MNAVTIHDLRADRVLAFDLIDILRLLETDVRALSWTCRNVEYISRKATSAEETDVEHREGVLGGEELRLDGEELLQLADGAHQVIDGAFIGTPSGGTQPRLLIVAVDSSYYVVVSTEGAHLDLVRRRFSDVRSAPNWAEHYAKWTAPGPHAAWLR